MIKIDCEKKINFMGKELQQVALDVLSSRNDVNNEVAKLLHLEQLYVDSCFEVKYKIIRLLLKERMVHGEFTFHNSATEIASVIFNLTPYNDKESQEKCDLQGEPDYDDENKDLHKELLNQTRARPIKASSMFWNKFSQITAFLKEMAYLSKLQLVDSHKLFLLFDILRVRISRGHPFGTRTFYLLLNLIS